MKETEWARVKEMRDEIDALKRLNAEMSEALEMVGPFLARYNYLDPNGDELIIKVADAIAKARGKS